MNRKIGKRAIAATLVIVALALIGQPAHAANSVYTFPDRGSYVPGDSGTITVTMINMGTTTIKLTNLTIYFPWAEIGPDGKWQGNESASYSNQIAASNVFTTTFQFTIPPWYSGGITQNCPTGTSTTRYLQYNNCVVVGSNSTNRYQYEREQSTATIRLATANYTPTSILTDWLPIATLAVLVVATAFLAMLWMSMRRTAKK